jgi:hypothetical protein
MGGGAKSPAKRILPIGIQDFPDIRERGFVYVDKTARVHDLITGSGKAFFLTEPNNRPDLRPALCRYLRAYSRQELSSACELEIIRQFDYDCFFWVITDEKLDRWQINHDFPLYRCYPNGKSAKGLLREIEDKCGKTTKSDCGG